MVNVSLPDGYTFPLSEQEMQRLVDAAGKHNEFKDMSVDRFNEELRVGMLVVGAGPTLIWMAELGEE